MCRLKIKVRIIGKKNQEFIKFILTPKNIRKGGKYLSTVGYWDSRRNKNTRYIIINIYKIMYLWCLGATWNKRFLYTIYNYFIDLRNLNNWSYFNTSQIYLFIENEIKNKYK